MTSATHQHAQCLVLPSVSFSLFLVSTVALAVGLPHHHNNDRTKKHSDFSLIKKRSCFQYQFCHRPHSPHNTSRKEMIVVSDFCTMI
jgi:hypothetical protein